MSAVIGFLTFRKTHTEVKLNRKLDTEQYEKMLEFLSKRQGAFSDNTCLHFVIARKLKHNHLQQLFNHLEIKVSIVGAEVKEDDNLEQSKKLDTLNKNYENSYKIKFGQFKGQVISDIPDYYLNHIIDNNNERALVDICAREIKSRNTVNIF